MIALAPVRLDCLGARAALAAGAAFGPACRAFPFSSGRPRGRVFAVGVQAGAERAAGGASSSLASPPRKVFGGRA